MRTYLKSVGILVLFLLAGVPAKAADYAYTVTKMGIFSPMGINNSGEVVGVSASDSGVQQAVLYDGSLSNLGSLNKENSYANGINDSGQVVGYLYTGTVFPSRAFLYSNGQMKDLNTLISPTSGLTLNQATAISNNGLIAGTCSTSTESGHIFIYNTNTNEVNDLGLLGTSNGVSGINDSGQVAGAYRDGEGTPHGITFYDSETITDLGNLGGPLTSISAINSNGQIVGSSRTKKGNSHAFVYNDGVMSDIDPSGILSVAMGINDSGEVVGVFDIGRAFFYRDGKMYDLNAMIDPELGISLNGAVGINNSGQIIAMGTDSNFNGFAYLLSPVPEPSMIALLTSCFGGIFAYNLYRISYRNSIPNK
jgi:probable HAF family extracellular repeat protein